MGNEVTLVIVALIALVAGVIVSEVRQLKNKVWQATPDQWRWALLDAANAAVRAAEQVAENNQEKLKWATEYVSSFMAQTGLKVNETLIRGAIENAYLSMKRELTAAVESPVVK